MHKKNNYLKGGRENQIIRIENTVHRPTGFWTEQVHKLLHFFHEQGFHAVPEPLGFDSEGREIVSYLEGEVSNYPLSENASSNQALISAAKLLRRYHDVSEKFIFQMSDNEKNNWQFPPRYPTEVICHGDFAPYNVVLNEEIAVGIIDFDTAHPAPRSWDIAYALYRWAPLTHPNNPDGFGSLDEQIKRACLFCDAYGLSHQEREKMPEIIIQRLQSLVDYMLEQKEKGNQTFALNIQEGHHLLYLDDIEYINAHKNYIYSLALQK